MNFPYTEQAERQMRQARKIIKEGRFIETWQNSGAVINLSYNDDQNKLWQIDMIQIRRGSKYDGYFENVARQITDAMTAPQRETILKLKFETPDNLKISGIEYYKAVIQNDISDIDTFLNWRQKQNFAGIIEW